MLTSEQLAALSKLWDEAHRLSEAECADWLHGLPPSDAVLTGALHTMLAAPPEEEDDAFLDTLPRFPDCEPEAWPEQLDAGDTVGPYRLIERLGAGGMSAVWLAQRSDGLLKRPVALKLPHPWLVHPRFQERFEREREILATLEHPRIARLYDAGIAAGGQLYLALEYVEGLPLTAKCDADGLDVKQRLQLFLQVLDAVQHAHSHRVVHRDLKPSNILVTRDAQVRLLDFGIAKLLGDEGEDTTMTQWGQALLTPSYASPEQVLGQTVSAASDVYSLGVLLYQLLSGSRPYRLTHPSRAAIEKAILQADIERPSTMVSAEHAQHCSTTPRRLSAALRGDLDTIVLTAMKKRPEERYLNAQAFADDIRRHLDGQPVLARPDSRLYRARKLLMKHRGLAAAVGAVMLSLAAGLVAALWQADQAREQRRTAEAAVGFLEDVFRTSSIHQNDPVKARTTTARELLDKGAQRIDGALADAPEARLHLLKTLAQMYAEMGLREESLTLMRKRAELARSLYPGTRPELLNALLDLAQAASSPATADEAQATLREVNERLDRLGDAGSLWRGRSERLQATNLIGAGPAAALPHLDAAVRILRLHPASCELLRALHDKSDLHIRLDEMGLARDATREVVRLAPAVLNCGIQSSAVLQSTLCWIESGLGDVPDAERHCREGLATEVKERGEDQPGAVIRTVDLATMLMRSSRLGPAIELMHGVEPVALKLSEREDFGEVGILWFKLGEALVLHGRVEEGLAVMDRRSRLDRRIANRGIGEGPVLERRAAGLIELGLYAEATQLLDSARALFARARFAPRSALNNHTALRVQLLLALDKPQEAAAELAAFVIPRGAVSPLAPDGLEKATLGAEIDLAKGRAEASSAAATAMLAEIARSPHPEHQALWQRRLELVLGRTQLQAGRAAQALLHFSRALQLSENLFDARSPAIADAQLWLAAAQLGAGQREEAARSITGAEQIHAQHKVLGEQHRELLRRVRAQQRQA